jgi:hypothetical protein
MLPHIGLLLQYCGNIYKIPNLLIALSSSDNSIHTAEPMIGALFRS